MKIQSDIEELRKLTRGIKVAETALRRATASALNKTATSVRAEAVRMISREYRVTQKDVRSELTIYRAYPGGLTARLVGSGSPGVPLYKFAPTPKRTPSTRRLKSGGYSPKKGIKVMIHRGSRKVVKGAFIARMASGHVGVFRRHNIKDHWSKARKKKANISELFGPSPLRILDSDHYRDPLDKHAQKTLDRNMQREAVFYLKKYGVLPNV